MIGTGSKDQTMPLVTSYQSGLLPPVQFHLTFPSIRGIIVAMVKVARKAIVLSISILHLALILPSSAGSVTCVDGDGLIKIEANCERTCGCEDVLAVVNSPVALDGRDTHEHDGGGDCTHFLLSTLLQVTMCARQLGSNSNPTDIMSTELVRTDPGLSDLKLQGRSRFDKNRPLLAQRIALLETTIVIC